jgi:hypothetical protein
MFSKRFRRAIAVLLLIVFVNSIVTPTISYALTAGPSSPEFSSFEPVDTTDLVNLATGELVYNTPVLEVPGPEGGYPLSLSYHAGIKMDQEASWVGLGWTLNPGAITRTVNGFADDNVASRRSVIDYWGGGINVTKSYSLGFNVPQSGIAINYSLARTRDSFKGFSVKSAAHVSTNPVDRVLSVVAQTYPSHVFNAIGQANSTIGQLGGSSSLGVSISSGGVKGSASVLGVSLGGTNHSAGRISSNTNELTRGSAFLFGLSFALKDIHTRYWSDEGAAIATYGSLYPGLADQKLESDFYEGGISSIFTSFAFDSYDAFDPTPNEVDPDQRLIDNANDPSKQLGGSLPAYDSYQVLGQGIGGVIQPAIFENGDLFNQNIYKRNGLHGGPMLGFPTLVHKELRNFSEKKVGFRFLNDFSNSLEASPAPISGSGASLSTELHQIQSPPDGWNSTTQKLAGSKHVEWFTNEEIANGSARAAGLVDFYEVPTERKLSFDIYENYLQPESCIPYSGMVNYGKADGSFKKDTYLAEDPYADYPIPEFKSLKPRAVDLSKKIGGFLVTNETGVNYHYTLPVYSYNEYTRSKLKNPKKGVSTFREYKNDDPYAYTWLLTAITGPDYIDVNGNHKIDDEDAGYWVKFDYGRWADAYQWRTPHTGYLNDIESEYQTFSYGIKELYYLDAIETRSHKALFIKSKRKDGRGVTSRLEGGSTPRSFRMKFDYDDQSTDGHLNFNVAPVATMKLDAIYLFRKSDLAELGVAKNAGQEYNEATTSSPHVYSYSGPEYNDDPPNTSPPRHITINSNDFIPVKYHNGDLVYDDDDIENETSFRAKALRVVKFDTDYSLCKNVPNSIGYYSDFPDPETCTSICTGQTGLEVSESVEWPTRSNEYGCGDGWAPDCCIEKEIFYSKNSIFNSWPAPCMDQNAYAGNDLEYFHPGKLTLKGLKFLGKGGADVIPATTFDYHGNPNYASWRYDDWGYLKSDYPAPQLIQNPEGWWIEGPVDPNTTREITAASAVNVKAWSLKTITNPLGVKIDIEYDPNQYEQSVYNNFTALSILNIEKVPSTASDVKVVFKEKGLSLGKWFALGNPVDIKALCIQAYQTTSEFDDETYTGNSSDVISEIGADFIVVTSTALTAKLTSRLKLIGVVWVPSVPYVISGFIKVNDLPIQYSGGIRVQSISAVTSMGIYKTVYDYTNIQTGSASSGVTSYKPFMQPSVQIPTDADYFSFLMEQTEFDEDKMRFEKTVNNFQTLINAPFQSILAFSREAPPPGVVYKFVTVRNYVDTDQTESYSQYQFAVFSGDMITRTVNNETSPTLDKRFVSIANSSIDIGNLLNLKVFNRQNQLVRSTEYNFLYDENEEGFEEASITSRQGVIDQSFHKNFVLKGYIWTGVGEGLQEYWGKQKVLVTKRTERSNVVTSVTETDHMSGIKSVTENHAFDFYSGAPSQVVTTDAYGSKVKSFSQAAYEKYPLMGLRVHNVGNKHMISQSAAQHSTLTRPQETAEILLSGSVQTWSNNIPVVNSQGNNQSAWRKHKTFHWQGAEDPQTNLYSFSDFQLKPFRWQDATQENEWQLVNEVLKYDTYSNAIEERDINGNFASVRMDSNHKKVICSTSNAKVGEMAFSGVEFSAAQTDNEGGVGNGDGFIVKDNVHSGQKSLLVGSGKTGFNFTLSNAEADLSRKYRASVWLYAPGEAETQVELNKIKLLYTKNGVEQTVHPVLQKSKSKSWYLLNIDIDPAGASEVKIECRNGSVRGVYFDDFRVHPLDGSMTSYVYNDADELSFILDANNFYTKFEYDAMGRLIRTSKELLNFDFGPGKESVRTDVIVNEMKYNYGSQE